MKACLLVECTHFTLKGKCKIGLQSIRKKRGLLWIGAMLYLACSMYLRCKFVRYAFILHASSIQVLFWLIYYIMVSSFLCTTSSSPSCSSFFKVALFPNMYYRISAGNDVLQWLCSVDVRECSTTQQGGDIVFRHKFILPCYTKMCTKNFVRERMRYPHLETCVALVHFMAQFRIQSENILLAPNWRKIRGNK